jgi:chromosome partitioning protein
VRTIAILNQKGGVGKTTTAVNLGAALALRGRRVLLIDADPQGNLSDHLGVDTQEAPASIYEVLLDEATLEEATSPTATPHLFVVPSHPDLAAVEQELASELGRELRLRRALRALPADRYDWVLIDCPPSLGLLSLNAMAASDAVLITVQTEYFAMRGLGQLDRIVQMVREHVNPDLSILGILPTLVNPVTKLAREVIQEVRAHYGAKVFATRIRQNVRLAEAPGYQNHIFAYEPSSAGAEDYAALAAELEGDREPVAPTTDAPVADAPSAPQAPRGAPTAPAGGGPAREASASNGAASPEARAHAAAPLDGVPQPDAPRAAGAGRPPSGDTAAHAEGVAATGAPPMAGSVPVTGTPRAWALPADLVGADGRVRMPPPRWVP